MRLAAERLGFSYPSPGGAPALADVTFELGPGECLGIIGGPGAGKSTLGRLLVGLLAPGSGRLTVGGVEAAGDRASRRRLVSLAGYVPQWPERQLFAATVAEDVAAGLPRGCPGPERAARADRALAAAGLDPAAVRDRPVFHLSGGEARKAALAGVLVTERPLLVLDEPTAGLDPASRREMARLLRGLKGEGRTLAVISHCLDDLLPLADRLLLLREGRPLFCGTPAEAVAGDALAGEVEWPPLTGLLLRLRRHFPEIPVLTADPEAAARDIAEASRRREPEGA